MFEETEKEINKKLETFQASATACKEMLAKWRAPWLLACEWTAKNFHGRAEKPEVNAVPSEYGDGSITFELVLKDGEAWSEILPLLELLADHGVAPSRWENSEDAANFARTFRCYIYSDDKPTVHWNITLALREGNLGGCRRIYVGKEASREPTIRDKYVLICDDVST